MKKQQRISKFIYTIIEKILTVYGNAVIVYVRAVEYAIDRADEVATKRRNNKIKEKEL